MLKASPAIFRNKRVWPATSNGPRCGPFFIAGGGGAAGVAPGATLVARRDAPAAPVAEIVVAVVLCWFRAPVLVARLAP